MAFSAISDCLGLLGWPPVVVQEEHGSSIGLVSNMSVLQKILNTLRTSEISLEVVTSPRYS